MEVNIKNREINNRNCAWMNPRHPNFERWKRARELSIERGKFVKSIIEKYIICSGLSVLDLGSGEGGTSFIFSERNNLTAYEINLSRFISQKNNNGDFNKVNGDAVKLPFKENSFDLIIMQDVIEHLYDINDAINEIYRALKPGGFIYISTPNKYSVFNLFSDPHWGLPVISILKRKNIKKFFLKYFRRNEMNRKDIPQLFSLKDIIKHFGNYFEIKLETKHSVKQLLTGNKGIIWSDFHLGLVKSIQLLRMEKLLLLISNNKIGFINQFFNPTFYLILKSN